MNTTQIATLANAIAQLIASLVNPLNAVTTDSVVATAPKAPTHVNPKAPKTVKPTTPVVATTAPKGKPAKANPAKLPMTPAGLIDVTKLAGLVKARAVAANNRTIAALAVAKAA